MVLTVSFELSPVTGLFCHRRPRTNVLSAPGRADSTSANLTPASGRQDHTTSPYAATSFVSSPFDRSQILVGPALHHVARLTLPRPPHPMPNDRDDRETPLCGVGRAELNQWFARRVKRNIFARGARHWFARQAVFAQSPCPRQQL